MDQVKYLNALNKIDGVGSQKMTALMEYFKSGEKIWNAEETEIIKAGISEKLASKIVSVRKSIDPQKEWEILEKEQITVVSIEDEKTYPPLLREISNPPYLLYAKGDVSLLSKKMIAVVGSRKFTEYGKRAAQSFGRDLANAGIAVVSGMALGIDAIAHQSALETDGKTIAVLGNSLDKNSIYPRSNMELSDNIIRNDGLLLSEYPVPTPPSVGTFPARNRIMAGMTLGTLVVEATLDSGSLITANLALDFNREIFAVPGPIFHPQSQGPHMLIKKGAKVTTSISDILEEIGIFSSSPVKESPAYSPASKEESHMLSILGQEPLHIDTIVKLTKLETSTVNSVLTMLEIKGAVKALNGQNYIKT